MRLVPPIFIDSDVLHLDASCSRAVSAVPLSSLETYDLMYFNSKINSGEVTGCSCLGAGTLEAVEKLFYDAGHVIDTMNPDFTDFDASDLHEFSMGLYQVEELLETDASSFEDLFKSTSLASWGASLVAQIESFLAQARRIECSPQAQKLVLDAYGIDLSEEFYWGVRPKYELVSDELADAKVFLKGESQESVLLLAPVGVLEVEDEDHERFDPEFYTYVKASDVSAEEAEVAIGVFNSGTYSSFVDCVEIARAVVGEGTTVAEVSTTPIEPSPVVSKPVSKPVSKMAW